MDKKYFYFDEDKEMFLVNNFMEWKKDDHGEYDSLWRAGISYIAYGTEKVKNGLLRAFRKKKNGKYQAARCNDRLGEDDVSRDQIIIAMSALKVRGDEKELKEIARNLPYKLSSRFNMTPNLWVWLRGITGCKVCDYLNQVYMLFELSISVLLNRFIKSQIKPIEYTQDELEYRLKNIGEHKIRAKMLNTKWKRFLWKIEFPGYALHLSMWMIYTSRNTFIKKWLQKILLYDADSRNLLCRLLCNIEVSNEEIENYKPMEEWRWSQRMTDLTRTRIIPQDNIGLFNIDKDILKMLKRFQLRDELKKVR